MMDIRDFQSIQAAIDEAEAHNGGEIRIPAGIWEHDTLVLSGAKNVRIRGEGWDSILQHEGTGPAISVGSPNSDRTSSGGVFDVLLKPGANSTNGIEMHRMHSSWLKRVRAWGFPGSGAVLSGCYAGYVHDSYFNDSGGDGLQVVAANGTAGNDFISIIGNRCLANAGNGIYVDNRLRSSAKGMIERNDIEGNGVGLRIDVGSSGNSDAWSIVNNYFENQIGANAEIATDAGATGYLRALAVKSNFVHGNGSVNPFRMGRIIALDFEDNGFAGADVEISADTSVSKWSANWNSGGAMPSGLVNSDVCLPRLVVRESEQKFATISMSGGKVKSNWPLDVMGTVIPSA